MFTRSSGVLLHVSSLPGPYGIGDLGPESRDWIDWLAETGCRYWQILPLGPSGFANSPYSSPSSLAGNIDLLSPDLLHAEGLIDRPDAIGRPGWVEYPIVRSAKIGMIDEAYTRQSRLIREEFASFREREKDWLRPYSLFMALKDANDGHAWNRWEPAARERDARYLSTKAAGLENEMDRQAFGQFLFHQQLGGLRRHAAEKGVAIIGDVPLYVATDSVDVWVHPELFAVDPDRGEPSLIAGVPPDAFSPIGQLWGTPTYLWQAHADNGYRWWTDRMKAMLDHADVLRLDHFTGFCRYYAVEAENPDPLAGQWFDGPGSALFDALKGELGDIPIIAEDLGPLGEEVELLRARLGYPGMRVLQEAFEPEPGVVNTPALYPEECVVYTGTHDNDTAQGRLARSDDDYRNRALAFAGGSEATFSWDLISRAWELTPVIAITPLQDLMGLGGEHRMNTPGTVEGNWEWRAPGDIYDIDLQRRLSHLNSRTGRHT